MTPEQQATWEMGQMLAHAKLELTRLRKVVEAARAIKQVFMHLEESYGRSLWTTGAGHELRYAYDRVVEALTEYDPPHGSIDTKPGFES